MVDTDSEVMSQGEQQQNTTQSSSLQHNQPKNNATTLQSLGRQSSIYSLTLDEFQNTLCESGKNFGSMNMDEFLNSIWTAEEAQAHNASNRDPHHHHPHPHLVPSQELAAGNDNGLTPTNSGNKAVTRQPSLPRQASLTIPETLCRKTVEEVWSEIHHGKAPRSSTAATAAAQRQPTFSEMTLEDFLVRAGVVREHNSYAGPPQPPTQHVPYGMYPNARVGVGPNFVARPLMVVNPNNVGGYQAMPNVGDASSYNVKRGGSYGARMGNGGGGGGGGFGQVIGSPVSPVSSDGMCASHHQHHAQVDHGGNNQYTGGGGGGGGGGSGGGGGKKRIIDGPVEKVVERRQRRMIKNRESAARSRARKQAYTVELEAELNQLKEENARMKQALAELEARRKLQCYQDARKAHQMQSRAYKNEKLHTMRRCLSAPR